MKEESKVITAIKNAQEGSLLHELTQKIAYGLHEKGRDSAPNANWYKAQDYFINYLTGRFGEFIYPLTGFLQNMINQADNSYRESGMPVQDIKYHYANVIINV